MDLDSPSVGIVALPKLPVRLLSALLRPVLFSLLGVFQRCRRVLQILGALLPRICNVVACVSRRSSFLHRLLTSYESGVYSSNTIFVIVGSLFDSIHMHTEVITRSWSAIASTQTAISLVNTPCFAVSVGGSRLRHSSSEYWKTTVKCRVHDYLTSTPPLRRLLPGVQ